MNNFFSKISNKYTDPHSFLDLPSSPQPIINMLASSLDQTTTTLSPSNIFKYKPRRNLQRICSNPLMSLFLFYDTQVKDNSLIVGIGVLGIVTQGKFDSLCCLICLV